MFTDRPFTGNPLAVVFGADGLAKDQMQALAREFNLSETAFVLPSERADALVRRYQELSQREAAAELRPTELTHVR